MDLGSRNNIRVEGGMSSMTDLVFLLLIFFIVMSTMTLPIFDVDLPQSRDLSEPLKDGYIDVIIKADGTYTVDGAPRPDLTYDEMRDLIIEQKNELINKGGVEVARLRINADKKSDFERFTDVMTIAKQNELKVSIVTD